MSFGRRVAEAIAAFVGRLPQLGASMSHRP
jgi:hypothetical protein